MILPASFNLFFWLLVGHVLCDTSLQLVTLGEMKRAPGWIGWMALFGHGLLHGGFVAYVTGSIPLGIAETIVHALIDKAKVENKIGLALDQGLHVLCKIAWIAIVMWR